MPKHSRAFSIDRLLAREFENRQFQDPDGDRAEFEEKLLDRHVDAVRIASGLSHLSYCMSVDGARKIVDGDPSGWIELHRAHQYEIWQFAVRFVRFDKAKVRPGQQDREKRWWFSGVDLADIAYHLAYSALVGWDGVVKVLGDRMLTCVLERNELFVPSTWSWSDSFPGFMVRLYAMSIGSAFPTDHPASDCGPYQSVFTNWHDESSLVSAIAAMCDIHCRQYLVEVGVFSHFPKSVIAAEILALRLFRTRLGIPTPSIEHALLDSPFVDIPLATGGPDDLLQRAMQRCVEGLPGVGPWW